MQKKLSIAFIWHMHQPTYKSLESGYYLMPWARLHAVKDYLDMLLLIEKFPNLKLNFNIVPSLMDTIEDYTKNNAHDLHSLLTVTPIENMSENDKKFILDNFFDANYQNMISHHSYYAELYSKRFANEEFDIDDFSNEEYSDILMWFNLAWLDPIWKKYYPELVLFTKKEKGFTLEDRKRIIEIHRDIMSKIIPTYKKYFAENKIEISVSPYYHPIMPLLNNINVAKQNLLEYNLPENISSMKEDLVLQIEKAINKFETVFGKKPSGLWPSEHAICEDTLSILADMGFKWTISDEGILSESIGKEFVRDFRGYAEDPYDLCRIYNFNSKNSKNNINILFRDSVLPNLINFEYPRHNSVSTANDCYDRIKYVQNKLENSPNQNNLLTIAMDGENCWESYSEDGHPFLETLYSMLENDETLETVLVSDYLNCAKDEKTIEHISAGSWINRSFQLWIAEPTKNLAWQYLNNVRDVLIHAEQFKHINNDTLKQAWQEVCVAESSDWFWWYGQPNDSGKDEIFDYLFREHLKNVYLLINEPIPNYLDVPLTSLLGKPSRYPKKIISPTLDGLASNNDEWDYAGCIEIASGPVMNNSQCLNRVYFGCDRDFLYFKFDINKFVLESSKNHFFSQIYLYFQNHSLVNTNSAKLRVVTREEDVYPAFKEMFTHEIKITFMNMQKLPVQLASVSKDGLWLLKLKNNIECVFKDVLELKIPFEDLDVDYADVVDFFVVSSVSGVSQEYVPQDILLSMQRLPLLIDD